MNFPWIILSLLTIIRLLIASWGHLSEIESYLLLCSHHLDWGFVEGVAGIPALMRFCEMSLGHAPFAIRFLSPLLLLGASWVVWRWVVELCNPRVAFWTLIAFNFLPLTNAAGVVMEGTMVTSCCWLTALWMSWRILTNQAEKNKISLWILFGVILAIGTQVTYQIGWLLLLVVIASLKFFHNEISVENDEVIVSSAWKKFFGIVAATFLLALSWLPLLLWNAHNEWLQFQNVTWDSFWSWPPWDGDYFQQLPVVWLLLALLPMLVACCCCFPGNWDIENLFFLIVALPLFLCVNALGHEQVPFAFILVVTVLFLPIAVEFFLQTGKRKQAGAFLLLFLGGCSLLLFFGKIKTSSAQESPWNFPSASGVIGAEAAAEQLIKLRTTYADTASGKLPFMIAETPGLAAILGAAMPIDYPERPGAPSVFVAESPALTSQFQFWPNYADAVTENTTPDPLYTEEKAVSPFLEEDAFYITTEKLEDLPQTITGAFAAVIPLSVTLSLTKNGVPQQLNVYLCQHYQMMAL